MLKLNYPCHALGRYPKVWHEGTKIFGTTKSGVTALLDDTSIQADSLWVRRDILRLDGEHLAPLNEPIMDYKDFILAFAGITNIIDAKGKIFLFRKRNRYKVVSFPILSIVEEYFGITTTFKRTTTRHISTVPPPYGAEYGLFLQHERYGEIFLGFSADKLETEIRA